MCVDKQINVLNRGATWESGTLNQRIDNLNNVI
jgi:hypothetical protein